MFLKASLYCLLIFTVSAGLGCDQDEPEPQPLTVSLPANATGNANSSITIPIRVSDLTGEGIISYQTVISFNENVLDATGASSTGTLTEAFGPPTVNTTNDGQIQLGGFGTAPLEGEGILVNLLFDVVGEAAETTSLAFENFYFNSGEPLSNTENGQFTVSETSGVENSEISTTTFTLEQNYPNPFNPSTHISFDLRKSGFVTLQIVNAHGQLVRQIANQFFMRGTHEILWDGRNELGARANSGLYLYKMHVGNVVVTKKMMLIK
jgi:hypothetical protein